MIVTLDISMYPLDAAYKSAIKAFVLQLRKYDQHELDTNQMSTQVRGEFDAVMDAVNACMKQSMADNDKVVFITKCLNGNLEISRLPKID